MDSLLKSLTQHGAEILAILIVQALIMLVWVAMLARKMGRQQARVSKLLRGASGENIEQLLERHLVEREVLTAQVSGLQARADALERKIVTTKRHVGLVRYDAFPDVGGSQSFALAVYDDQGNGAVVTSIVGRSDCRVYCKPLLNGGSERTLSQEEQRAIREARSEAPKAIVSE